MSQKQYKALHNLARSQTKGKHIDITKGLYKDFKKRLSSDRKGTQALAKIIKSRSHNKVRSFSGEVPEACPPALHPYPKSRITKGYKSDSYHPTKGFKKQSQRIVELYLTGFTPWTMGVL